MQTNPESAAVEAVAWRYRLNEKGNDPWGFGPWGYETLKPTLSPSGFYDAEPLYSAATVAALEAEVAENEGVIAVWRRRCEEAERRVAELEAALRMARDELGGLPHSLGYEFTHLPKIDEALTGDGAK